LDMGYSNQPIIKAMKALKQSGYIYKGTKKNTRSNYDIELKDKLRNNYKLFQREYPEQYNRFMQYITYRLGDINPIKYGISPLMKNNKLLIEFYNSSGNPITARFIEKNNMRYLKYKDSGYYYYQSIKDITGYNDITISEGIFDIINLSNYYPNFKENFFFAINGRKYTSILSYLISKYFLIGKYNFNIVFDSDVSNIEKTKQEMINIKLKLNKQCTLKFYKPDIKSIKDVSNLMTLKEI